MVEICFVGGRVKQPIRSFWYKFPGVRWMSDLPSESNQIKHMKKPYIASLWAKKNPVRFMLVLLSVEIYISHNLPVLFVFHWNKVGINYNDIDSVIAQVPENWWITAESCKYTLACFCAQE